MTYLLDTCVLSKLRKIRKYPDIALENWICAHDESQYFLSVLTVGEIQQGISKLQNGKEKRILEEWLRGEVFLRFKDRILDIDLRVAAKWGELNGIYRNQGITIPVVDGLIAATAMIHQMVVVTENIKNFCCIDEVMLFSPWEYRFL